MTLHQLAPAGHDLQSRHRHQPEHDVVFAKMVIADNPPHSSDDPSSAIILAINAADL